MGVAYFLGLVPRLELAEVVIGAGRQLELEIEAEEAVDVLHEVEQRAELVGDLRMMHNYQHTTSRRGARRDQARSGVPATAYKTHAYHPARTASPSSSQSTRPTPRSYG